MPWTRTNTHSWLLFGLINFFLCFYLVVYEDLFVPLKKKCPEALNAPNKAGLTPQDVLDLMNDSQVSNLVKLCNTNLKYNVIFND